MNAKQLAAATATIAIAASIPPAIAQDDQHEGDHPEVSPALVRDL
jgi:hypothetical protein